MTIEQRKEIALNVFRTTYPSITSADLQTFVLGMQAMEKIYQDINIEDLQNECELNSLENQS
jgi:hypothetical protein